MEGAPTTKNSSESTPDNPIALERMRILYQGLPSSLFFSVCAAVLISLIQFEVIGQKEIIWWNLFIGFSLVVRTFCWLLWINLQEIYRPSLWITLYRWGVALSGLAWASTGLLLFPHHDHEHQTILVMTLLAMTTITFSGHTIDHISALLFSTLALSPTLFLFVLSDNPQSAGVTFLCLATVFFAFNNYMKSIQGYRELLQKNHLLKEDLSHFKSKERMEKTVRRALKHHEKYHNIFDAYGYLLKSSLQYTRSHYGFLVSINMDKTTGLCKAIAELKSIQTSSYDVFSVENNETLFPLLISQTASTATSLIISTHLQVMQQVDLPKDHPEINNLLAIPLREDDELIGILVLCNSIAGYTEGSSNQLAPLLKGFLTLMCREGKGDLSSPKASSSVYQQLIEKINVGVLGYSGNGSIVFCNHYAHKVLGIPSKAIDNERIDFYFDRSVLNSNDAAASEILASMPNELTTATRKNNTLFPCQYTKISTSIDNQQTAFLIFEDITQQHQHRQIINNALKIIETSSMSLLNTSTLAAGRIFESTKTIQSAARTMTLPLSKKTYALETILNNVNGLLESSLSNVSENIRINNEASDAYVHTEREVLESALFHLIKFLYKVKPEQDVIYVKTAKWHENIRITLGCDLQMIDRVLLQDILSKNYPADMVDLFLAEKLLEKSGYKLNILKNRLDLQFYTEISLAPSFMALSQ